MEVETELLELLKNDKIESLELCRKRGKWRIVYINKDYHRSYLYDIDSGYLKMEDKNK